MSLSANAIIKISENYLPSRSNQKSPPNANRLAGKINPNKYCRLKILIHIKPITYIVQTANIGVAVCVNIIGVQQVGGTQFYNGLYFG